MPYTHPIYGPIPPVYRPPLSDDVVTMARRIASDELRHAHAYGPDGGDDTPRLFAFVRMAMGRCPADEINAEHRRDELTDAESICQGIVDAINAYAGRKIRAHNTASMEDSNA